MPKSLQVTGTADEILKACGKHKEKLQTVRLSHRVARKINPFVEWCESKDMPFFDLPFISFVILCGFTFFMLFILLIHKFIPFTNINDTLAPFVMVYGVFFIGWFFGQFVRLYTLISMLRHYGDSPSYCPQRINLFTDFLNTLHDDIHPKARCRLRMKFQGYAHDGKRTENKKDKIQGRNSKILHRHFLKYVDRWVFFSGKFHDGNKVKLILFSRAKTKVIRNGKLNYRGKYKFKKIEATSKVVEEIRLTMRMNTKIYPKRRLFINDTLLTFDRFSFQNNVLRLSATLPEYFQKSNESYQSYPYYYYINDRETRITGEMLVQFFTSVYAVLKELR